MSGTRNRRQLQFKTAEEAEEENRKKTYELKIAAKQELLEKEFEKQILQQNVEEEVHSTAEAALKAILDQFQDSNHHKRREIDFIEKKVIQAEKEENYIEEDSVLRMKDRVELHYKEMSQIVRQISKDKPQYYHVSPFLTDQDIDNLMQWSQQLEELYQQLEVKIILEEETTDSLNERLKRLSEDNLILSKRVQENTYMLNHATKRFGEVDIIEDSATLNEKKKLKELEGTTNNLESKQKFANEIFAELRSKAGHDHQKLQESKKMMSEVLLKIEEYRLKQQETQETLEELENRYNHMIEKKAESKYIVIYTNILDELSNTFIKKPEEKQQPPQQQNEQNLAPPSLQSTQSNKSSDARIKRYETSNSLKHSSSTIFNSPLEFKRNPNSLKTFTPRSMIFDDELRAKEKIYEVNQAKEKNQIIRAIYDFYGKYTEGPGILVEKLIREFKDMIFHENSLRSLYEHLSELKNGRTSQIELLTQELYALRATKQEHDKEKGNAALNDDQQEQPANQIIGNEASENAKNNQISFETFITLNSTFQKLMFTLYLDMSELIYRIGHILDGISFNLTDPNVSFQKDLEKTCSKMMTFIKELRAPKQTKLTTGLPENQKTVSNDNQSVVNAGAQIGDTGSVLSFDYQDSNQSSVPADVSSTNGIQKLFLDLFEGCNAQFKDFDEIVKSDILVRCFLKEEDIKDYLLQQKFTSYSKEEGAAAALSHVAELFRKSTQVYLSRVDKFFSFYCELVSKFLNNQQLVKNLHKPRPKLILTESYKMFQEKRAIKLCNQLDLKHPKIRETHWWKEPEQHVKNSAKKEEKPIKGLQQAEVEQKITELAQKVQINHRSPIKSESKKNQKPATALPESLPRKTLTKGMASEVVIRKHVDNFISITRQSAQEKEQFELEREAIRKDLEEKMELYRQEQFLLENPPNSHDFKLELERLCQSGASDYKKKMIKNSHALSQINILETHATNNSKSSTTIKSNYALLASIARSLGIKHPSSVKNPKKILAPKIKSSFKIELDPTSQIFSSSLKTAGGNNREFEDLHKPTSSKNLFSANRDELRINLLTPSSSQASQTRKLSMQVKIPSEFSRYKERHQTEPKLAYNTLSPRESLLKTSRMNTRDTNLTIGMTSSPTEDTNRGKSIERSLPEIKLKKVVAKQPVKKKNSKKLNLPKGEKYSHSLLHQHYFSDFFYASPDLSSPYQFNASRVNTGPSILVETPRSVS